MYKNLTKEKLESILNACREEFEKKQKEVTYYTSKEGEAQINEAMKEHIKNMK